MTREHTFRGTCFVSALHSRGVSIPSGLNHPSGGVTSPDYDPAPSDPVSADELPSAASLETRRRSRSSSPLASVYDYYWPRVVALSDSDSVIWSRVESLPPVRSFSPLTFTLNALSRVDREHRSGSLLPSRFAILRRDICHCRANCRPPFAVIETRFWQECSEMPVFLFLLFFFLSRQNVVGNASTKRGYARRVLSALSVSLSFFFFLGAAGINRQLILERVFPPSEPYVASRLSLIDQFVLANERAGVASLRRFA